MSEHTSGTAQPQQAADTTPENPWPLSRLSDNLKQYIERVSPTWVEGQLIEHRLSRGHAWMTLRDAGQVTVGDDLDILVAAGRLTATATSVTETTQE